MTWLTLNWHQVIQLTLAHLGLSVPAIIFSTVIAVPLGRFAYRKPKVGGMILGATSLLYAIPALPLLIIIPALFAIPLRSSLTMIIALVIYGVALLARTAADAFGSVNQKVRESAFAIGYSSPGIFWRVDLPLAIPVILSGVRVVAVSTISLVTVGSLIGVSNLGNLLTDGFQRGIIAEVVTGILATITLALLADGLLLLFGRLITPWTRSNSTQTASTRQGGQE